MSSLKKAAIGGGVVVVALVGMFLARSWGGADAPEVRGEPIARRNLVALVSASGTIQPQLTVDISAA